MATKFLNQGSCIKIDKKFQFISLPPSKKFKLEKVAKEFELIKIKLCKPKFYKAIFSEQTSNFSEDLVQNSPL